jgi:hypothetical protein
VNSEKAGLAAQIEDLTSADEGRRSKAAAALFDRGARLAWSVSQAWMNDGALTGLFAVESYGQPGDVHPETTVGIAVTPEIFDRIQAANGNPEEAAVPPEQDAREFELHFPPNVRLDILTPRQFDGNGAIARYLQRHGVGIQQVEFRVNDVAGATGLLSKGYELTPVYPRPQAGANGARTNFFLVVAPDGEKLLIELFEAPFGPANPAPV